ncbi:MAG: translation initiation factor IF-6 [Candidatus Micrarchaeota archaeon]|nr:translation initiation factor IF-6 [Candidatus Micrarchaeota archaeon]
MVILKTDFQANEYIGIYSKTCENYTIIPDNSPKKFEEAIEKSLGTEIIKTKIAQSPLIGFYITMNSYGIILPPFCTEKEIESLKVMKKQIYILKDSRYCANGNNIACNDYGAIINPDLREEEVKKIEQTLNVPVYKTKIADYKTVGMMVVPTNKGFVINKKATIQQLKNVEEYLKVKGSATTANLGVGMVGLSIVANTKGAVIGSRTSGFELLKIQEGLEL